MMSLRRIRDAHYITHKNKIIIRHDNMLLQQNKLRVIQTKHFVTRQNKHMT